jgi:hypothetical protein
MRRSTMLMIGAGLVVLAALLVPSWARIVNDLAGMPVQPPVPPIQVRVPELARIDGLDDKEDGIYARWVPGGCLYYGRSGGQYTWGAFAYATCTARPPAPTVVMPPVTAPPP